MARLDPLEIERKPVEAASELVVRGYMKTFGELGNGPPRTLTPTPTPQTSRTCPRCFS